MAKKPNVNKFVAGKTVKQVTQNYDRGQLHCTEIQFTDGTALSIMHVIYPDVEMTFLPPHDGSVDVSVTHTRR